MTRKVTETFQDGAGRSWTQFLPHGGPQLAELATIITWCMGVELERSWETETIKDQG
jgi:hypothetical protein